MLRLLTGRLLAAVPLMFLVATLVFFLAQANSADPAGSILGLDASEESVAAKRAELGVDRPRRHRPTQVATTLATIQGFLVLQRQNPQTPSELGHDPLDHWE